MSRKEEAIDIMRLWSQGSANGWNDALTKYHVQGNIRALARLRYGLQAGMDDLTKSKLNNEKISLFFVRLQKSIENTMRAILREKYPNPFDDPLYNNRPLPEKEMKWREVKRRRDQEMNAFLKQSGY